MAFFRLIKLKAYFKDNNIKYNPTTNFLNQKLIKSGDLIKTTIL